MTKILTVLLFIFLSPGQTINWKTFEGSNYSIQYPPDWELNQSGLMNTSFILFSPLESSDDKFRENVNLLIQDLSGKKIDLNKFTEISTEQVKTMILNSHIIENKRIKNNAGEYHKMHYSGDQGAFHLEFEQYYWVFKDKAYVLTFTCEQTKFTKFKEMAENILNSFAFKK